MAHEKLNIEITQDWAKQQAQNESGSGITSVGGLAHRIGQFEEPVLVAAQDDEVLRQAAQMHHRERAGIEECRGKVAIGRRIDAVRNDAREMQLASQRPHVDRVAGAGNRSGPERQRIGFVAGAQQAIVVAAKRRGVPLVPFLFDGFADNSDFFQPDGIHPTASAQPLMLDIVWKELRPLLKRP